MERNRAVIICLGGGLKENSQPSDKVKARLDKAYQLFSEGDFNAVITTSKGTFRDANDHPITEAEAGSLYLIGRGINRASLLKEERAMDTIGNAFFSRVLFLDPKGWWRPTIITNEFHMQRVRLIFDQVLDTKYQPEYVVAPMKVLALPNWKNGENMRRR